jgi:hypothetical protein
MAAAPSCLEKAGGVTTCRATLSEASPLELQDRLAIPRIALVVRLRLGRDGLYLFAVESEDVRQPGGGRVEHFASGIFQR